MAHTADRRYSNPLPQVYRFITAHDDNGRSVFDTRISEQAQFYNALGDPSTPVGFFLGYTTECFPAALGHDNDLVQYQQALPRSSQEGLVKRGGSVLRFIDYPPRFSSPMHRTVSLDYGILIHGELECHLDTGERRTLKPGDVAIQRGTMHAWVNPSTTEWARMYYVLMEAAPVTVNGNPLGEDYGGMELQSSH
jgi:quercetin dioxygenase-like cupin family protein